MESDDDDPVIDSRRKRRRTDADDLNQVREALAEAREKHAALQQQQIKRDAQITEEYAEARTQLQTYIQANETLQKELSNMAGRELELKEAKATADAALPIMMTPALTFGLFVLTVAMCAIAAVSAIRVVTRIDPVLVFAQ